jgi:hypothetical protein
VSILSFEEGELGTRLPPGKPWAPPTKDCFPILAPEAPPRPRKTPSKSKKKMVNKTPKVGGGGPAEATGETPKGKDNRDAKRLSNKSIKQQLKPAVVSSGFKANGEPMGLPVNLTAEGNL